LSTVYQNHVAEPRILINEIRGHEENGILVTGVNNFTVIKNNTAIRDNKKAGIRIENHARARIIANKISNNLNQGVLIVENSSAYVHGNYIYQNIKANIAFGGSLSENTMIVRNKIFNSASEGIFMILAGRCIVNMNEVYGNYDGIIAIESVPNLHFNSIFRNRNNGVIMLRGSKADMRENNIYENEGVGLVLREKSFGPSIKNVIQDNEMDLVVEYETPNLQKELIEKNSIGPDQRLPQRTNCNLI
jgi:parallel beta-helix repeat protein